MDCAEAQRLMDQYVARELDAAAADGVAEHVAGCANCASMLEQMMALHEGALDLRQPAPAEFHARVRAALRGEDPARQTRLLQFWRITAIAACLVAVLSTVLALLPRGRVRDQMAMADEVVAAHVRSLMADHLVDVKSSNEHNVKPWFTGRVDFAPDVRNFEEQGFKLVGGRLDYFDHRPVISIVYRHDKHVINAFTWPTGENRAESKLAQTRQGYHLVQWNDGEMTWCVVSDAGEPVLEQLHHLLEEHPATSMPSR